MNSQQTHRSVRAACALAAITGMVLAGMGAWTMDLTAISIGMLMTMAAVAGSRALGAFARIKSRLHETNEQLAGIRAGLSAAESSVSQSFQTSQDEPDTPPIEMLSLGGGDPRVLTAATLDGDTFPRLATRLNEAAVESATIAPDEEGGEEAKAAPTVVQMNDAPDETERRLRQEFSQRARHRDYAGLLDVGRRICKQLPDRPIAAEYERLEPALIRKAAAAQSDRRTRRASSGPGAIVFDHSRRAGN